MTDPELIDRLAEVAYQEALRWYGVLADRGPHAWAGQPPDLHASWRGLVKAVLAELARLRSEDKG